MRRGIVGLAMGIVFGACLAACATGSPSVYVGVGVAGPWGGYGGYPYPGRPIGYPGFYDDDAQEDRQDETDQAGLDGEDADGPEGQDAEQAAR